MSEKPGKTDAEKTTKVKKEKLRKPRFATDADLEIEARYDAASLAALGFDPARDLGQAGEYPFTRGVHDTMYRARLWTMRQYAGFGTAAESNKRYKFLLSQGQTGISVAFDLPTQMGLDSDHPRALGEVGRTGVAISSIEDMRELLDELPLEQLTTSMTINSTAAILLSLYVAVADERGVGRDKLGGTIQNDILKEYMARGTYIYPPRPSMRITTDVFAFCKAEVPKWNTISISGYHIREAGCDAVQEVAFTLGDGVAYVKAAVDAGLDVDDFAPRLAFFFNGHNNFLEEVAKFRAARRLWARIMKERFGAKDPRSQMLRFHTQTAGSTLQARQPLNTVVRTTIQALAAVLGGTQSLHTNAYDEALSLPTEDSALLALRTQQVIAHESGAADFVDALAGSYAVESLTTQIERGAEDYLRRIDELGGMVAAIEQAFPQREIERRAYEHQRAVEEKRRIVVGTNEFVTADDKPPALHKLDAAVEKRRAERLRAFRARRDQSRTDAALADLERAARGPENVVPRILAAVKAEATLGEIADRLRRVFGEHSER